MVSFSRDHNLPLGLALRSRRNKVNVITLLFSAAVPDESKTELKIETESECFIEFLRNLQKKKDGCFQIWIVVLQCSTLTSVPVSSRILNFE